MKKLLAFIFSLGVLFDISAQKVQDFSSYFKEKDLEGGFFMYNYQKKEYLVSDKGEFLKATSPASTFKILNSLIALETGAIKDENEIIKWDGQERSQSAWNADHDLKNAYKNSTVWFYQELARRIGEDKYRKYLKACNYGNQDISGGLTTFWLGSSMLISPKNQLEFLVKLHEEKLPFSKRTFDIVKKIMIREQTPEYLLRAKTGWSNFPPTDIGWFIGYIEAKSNTYFFVTRVYKPVDKKLPSFGADRVEITNTILKALHIP
ncbi:class D beta-lactamase [Emticicia sp. 21SJ11W-3]|uniref:class D beta-lactamase n=1 Tax=Emticicia sp. 21SJ11W-3 TaxID=2916755 RepID=UPI00209EC842|nr:class D beta-lactamase [Emticicia sp. 21SJ11W-3]UTA68527.1 class D beta-lactamase [Emticicia sp. 21SJ11W-3]